MSKLDQEYYIMSVDGADNHPMLTWGDTDYDPFIFPRPIQDEDLDLPLKVWFSAPYPKIPEMADILFLDGDLLISKKVVLIFETMDIHGVQFFPAEVITNKNEVIKEYYVLHPWNRIAAVDKNNYVGSPVTEKGRIDSLQKFSLDENVLSGIPLEERLMFHLAESKTERLIHKSIYEALINANITGFSFFRVDEWDSNAMFR